MLFSGIKKLSQISSQRTINFNFFNEHRLPIILLSFTFILSMNVFLSTSTLDRRFNRAVKNEEIDGIIDSTLRINRKKTSTLNMVKLNVLQKSRIQILEAKNRQLNSECFIMSYKTKNHSKNNKIDQLCDLLITIKTTIANHKTRIKLIVDTWFKLISSKVNILKEAKF